MRGRGCCVSTVPSRGRQEWPSTSGARPRAVESSSVHGVSSTWGAAASPALSAHVARRATPSRVAWVMLPAWIGRTIRRSARFAGDNSAEASEAGGRTSGCSRRRAVGGGWKRNGRPYRGSAGIVGEGKVVRPSQLIRSVRPTCGESSTWEPPRAWSRRAVRFARTERLRRPRSAWSLAGYSPSKRGRACRGVPSRPAADRSGQVRLVLVPAQVSRRPFTARLNVGRRSVAGPVSSGGAPCHALQGGVGDTPCVDRAYDLAELGDGWRRQCGVGRGGRTRVSGPLRQGEK
jgi:hypothetical protein